MRPRAEQATWLAGCRDRIIVVLALALAVTRDEICSRLGIRSAEALRIVLPPARSPRPRGRPRRVIDRDQVLEAMRRHGRCQRAVARATKLPRTTLSRYLRTIPDSAWIYGAGISERHGELLAASAIDPEVARSRGYRSEARGLRLPLWHANGCQMWSQLRVDDAKRRRSRYRNDRHAAPIVDVSPWGRQRVLDRDRPLYVTEGVRKADAAVSLGLACVAVAGVRMLCLDDAQWDYIGIEGRNVYVVFDADAAHNREVEAAEGTLAAYLVSRGARVRVVRLPGHKTGLDDYLAEGHGEADLIQLADDVDVARKWSA
jgi:hypothetical protein